MVPVTGPHEDLCRRVLGLGVSQLTRAEAEEEVVEFDDWLLDFAELFREHLGIDADGHVDLHNEGLEKCNQALEAAVGSEAAVPLFEQAAAKFQVGTRRSGCSGREWRHEGRERRRWQKLTFPSLQHVPVQGRASCILRSQVARVEFLVDLERWTCWPVIGRRAS